MGMYTALEMHVKLKWDSELVKRLSYLMFDSTRDEGWDTQAADGAAAPDSDYRFQRMLWTDGGRSFGPSMRWLEAGSEPCPGCDNPVYVLRNGLDVVKHEDHDKTFVMFYVRSSYKGTTHWDFIDWLKPHALGGFVRWNQEGVDREDVHRFGPLDESDVETQLISEAAAMRERAQVGTSRWTDDRVADGMMEALTRLRGSRTVLPAAIRAAFQKCKDECPRSLRHEIERYL